MASSFRRTRVSVLSTGLLCACVIWVVAARAQTPRPTPASLSQRGESRFTGQQQPNAASFGIWSPSRRDTCTKADHDAYSVIGPDGKRYPTWHPPTGPNGCTFGHEHGRDPRQSTLWSTKQIQRYFYFDANGNHQMDPDEEAVAGIPFGYANEQYHAYNSAHGSDDMRHEDHVGHKIDWVNGEADLATHRMTTNPTGGAWIGTLGDGVVQRDTRVRCSFLAKVHQGVTTSDAFTNNLHEVMYFNDCRHPDPAYDQQVSIAQLAAFNRPGGFTKFMPLCGIERRGQPQDFVEVAQGPSRRAATTTSGDREIATRDCIENGVLVPPGKWSGNMYEAWPATLRLSTAADRQIVGEINLLFDVEDAIRYFYPESLKAQRAYTNSAAGLNLGFTMDLCYDTSLADRQRLFRGGLCDAATAYGKIRDISWDDPRSGFRGLHRGMYFMPAVIDNAAGPAVWYTDALGGHASNKPFVGAVAQQVTSKRLNYTALIGGRSLDPRVTDRVHDDGSGTVHAPN